MNITINHLTVKQPIGQRRSSSTCHIKIPTFFNFVRNVKMIHHITMALTKLIANVFKSKNVVEAMNPAVNICRTFAALPFNFKVEKGKSKSEISIKRVLFSAFMHIAYLICVIIVIVYNQTNLDTTHALVFHVFAEKLQIYVGFALMAILVIDAFSNKDNLAKAFQKLIEVDEIFESLGRHRIYFMMKFKIFIAVLCFYSFNFVSSMWDAYLKTGLNLFSWSYPLMAAIYGPTFNVINYLSFFATFIFMIAIDLSILNEEIIKLTYIEDSVILNFIKTKDSMNIWKHKPARPRKVEVLEKLLLIWKGYIKISDCCFLINQYFARKILVIIAHSFIGGLFNMFFVMTSMSRWLNDHLEERDFLVFSATRFIIHSVNMFVMVSLCSYCQDLVS